MQNHKYVFICGMHKSGTSIFSKVLAEHPSISGFENTGVPQDEGQHLQSVYKPANVYGGMGKFGFHPEARLIETSSLVTEENKRKLMTEWTPYWDMNKPVLVEKSPPNLIRTRFLQAMFPNSYFLVILRHPIANAYATKKKRFQETELDSRLKHWLVCHDIFNEDRSHLKNLLTFQYENFVKNTSTCLEQIYAFLDIEYVPPTLEIRPNVNEKYFAQWLKFREKPIVNTYADYLIGQYEDRVKQYGYSLENLEY